MNSAEVKKAALSLGADLVGIAPVERFDGMEKSADPRTLMPNARSVIALGYRLTRGTLRGVEEGTSFGNTYIFFGQTGVEQHHLSKIMYDLCCVMEDTGAEACPVLGKQYSTNKFIPDYKAYAHAAGLGSVGKGGFFLTREFGPRQRFGFIFTDLVLEGDEVIECDLCKDCNACITACPLGAYSAEGHLDLSICSRCHNGAYATPQGSEEVDRLAAACARACIAASGEKITNRLTGEFRVRSVWSLDQYGEALNSGNQFTGGKCPDKFEGK